MVGEQADPVLLVPLGEGICLMPVASLDLCPRDLLEARQVLHLQTGFVAGGHLLAQEYG